MLSSSLVPANALAAACNLRTQWTWVGATRDPLFPEPCITPLVVQLTDDNLDGRVDRNDRPDVVFTHFSKSDASWPAVITAVDGATGVEHFTIRDPKVQFTALAAGDIDGDGVVEIVAIHDDRRHLVAFENTGSVKWTSDPVPWDIVDVAAVGIADLDQDGVPEIYVGSTVFGADGALRWFGSGGIGNSLGAISNAVDLVTSVPGLELLAGRTAYSPDGTIVWNRTDVPDGWTAIADFDGDGDPEIVLTKTDVRLLDHDGNPLGPAHAMAGFLSQPLVADIDGDGAPEVIAIDGRELQALEWTGSAFSVAWRVAIDDSSRINGAAAYDFDGDGAAEIVYHDQYNWYIFDGRSGTEQSKLPYISATLIETPVIANIDDDCNPEILISGCQGGPAIPPGSPNSVTAYECDGAVPARSIWNQFQYHATNVEDDGGIPRVEPDAWRDDNSWIAQMAGPGGPVADAGLPLAICTGDTATLDASASIPCPLSVALYRWSEGPVERCSWRTAPTCAVTPAATTIYTLQVRCVGGPEPCTPIGTATVRVEVKPEVIPPNLGNVVRAVRRGVEVELTWSGPLSVRGYGVYRDVQKSTWPPAPFRTGLTATTDLLRDVPSPPDRYFYRVVGESCSGVEGP